MPPAPPAPRAPARRPPSHRCAPLPPSPCAQASSSRSRPFWRTSRATEVTRTRPSGTPSAARTRSRAPGGRSAAEVHAVGDEHDAVPWSRARLCGERARRDVHDPRGRGGAQQDALGQAVEARPRFDGRRRGGDGKVDGVHDGDAQVRGRGLGDGERTRVVDVEEVQRRRAHRADQSARRAAASRACRGAQCSTTAPASTARSENDGEVGARIRHRQSRASAREIKDRRWLSTPPTSRRWP